MGNAPTKYDIGWFDDADQLGKKTGLGGRDPQKLKKALELVDAFRKRSGSGQWKNLDRQKVARGLELRLNDPDSFDQGDTWLCGIATFVRVWAFDHPVEYVKLAIDLFEKGEGRLEGHSKYSAKPIVASTALKNSELAKLSDKKTEYDHADWIVLASIRAAFNDVFDYGANEGIFRIKAWNFPGDVEREFKAAGYKKVVNKANGLGGGGFGNLSEAADLYERDWRVILLINSRLLNSNDIGSTGAINHSNHWVGLNSSITINPFGQTTMVYPFQVYSWNGIKQVPVWNKPIPFETVNKSYFGFVAGLY